MTRSFLVGLLAVLCGCAGAIPTDVDGDLPEDFDESASTLVSEPEPDTPDDVDDESEHQKGGRDDKGDRDHDRKRHKKRKHRHHHLFKKLDRLDGDRDGRIVIAVLPPRVPSRLVEKLREIDTDDDGVVTRAESHEFCHKRHHDWGK